jgi:beta-aspartyl-peptidase (threonine type)
VVAISCTGEGEAFIQGVVAHDISARMRYLNATLAEAITTTMAEELDSRDASGGIIAVSADGGLVVAHNSPAIFAAYRDHDRLITLT